MLSAVADTNKMRDGLHTLEAKQSKDIRIGYTFNMWTPNVS